MTRQGTAEETNSLTVTLLPVMTGRKTDLALGPGPGFGRGQADAFLLAISGPGSRWFATDGRGRMVPPSADTAVA